VDLYSALSSTHL